MKTRQVFMTTLFILGIVVSLSSQTLWLDELDLNYMEAGWGNSHPRLSVEGNKLRSGGQEFTRGVGTHAVSKLLLNLHGSAGSFSAQVGVDDEATDKGSIEFIILGDKKILWQSGLMKKGDKPKPVNLDLHSISKLGLLVSDGGDGIDYDHADWLDAKIEYHGKTPEIIKTRNMQPYILTPASPDKPRINGAMITGAGPGKAFLFYIPVSGKRPLTYTAERLPVGLNLQEDKGIITGTVAKAGEYKVKITVENSLGKVSRDLKIVIGDKLALTPPLGWNSWNCWGLSVDDKKVKASADAMVTSGLIDHGWTYINIDDGWEAPERTPAGEIHANEKFPDMKALCEYVHSKGLKIGIYSSPGPKTCGGYLASWQHELQDAQTWSKWGIDYLKYDWCSYDGIAKDKSLSELKKPYTVMHDILKRMNRDIVFSLCQYGMGNVWEWGESVGGNSWRTTGDINDSWSSMAGIGFSQDKCSSFAGPGHWNDPDMLVVGQVGWGPGLHQTRLTPDEQYTHISLWALLAAPMLIGCDMSQMDAFTLNLLTNDEVLSVSQDPLGKQARRISQDGENEIWMKELEDGSKVVGIFYTKHNGSGPAAEFQWDEGIKNEKIGITLKDMGLKGKYTIRDVWRQKDLGKTIYRIEAEVPWHGVALLKLVPEK